MTHNSSTTISYWAPSSPSRFYMQLHTPLTLAQIQLVHSYEDFGVLHIPASEPGLANFLHRRIEFLETSSQDAQMMSKLVANLHSLKASDGGGDGTKVNILSTTVLGDESGHLIPEGYRLLWKWAKPHSQYRKSGFWDYSLTKVLMDAEWNAGKGVLILVKAVEEQEYERVMKGETKTDVIFS
ncbi:uncharacterized protein ALTATR162_LOCUS8611 [Alternaria atra]|uniref:Uncharacterized protein n=1 Tax=Alternaria atra TaxID=119953 RepID=A0A8J2N2F1_9PLEO|nr:uncharacterized protein ALTATR162_LOCUS8611 [Alternaria atra]CAG5178259.1 unnamed protein product [Alternaria atra]